MQNDGLAGVVGGKQFGVGGIVVVRIGRDAERQKHHEGKNKGKDLTRVFHKLTSISYNLIAHRQYNGKRKKEQDNNLTLNAAVAG